MTVPECINILEQYLDGHKTNFARLIPQAVWREMAANVRFAMIIANVSEAQMQRVMATDFAGSPVISIETVRIYTTEGGALEPMLRAMRHCGFHPLAIFKKDLRAAVREDVLSATWKVGENVVMSSDADNMFRWKIKRECAKCRYQYRMTAPNAEFCPGCGIKLEQEVQQIDLWKQLDRRIGDIDALKFAYRLWSSGEACYIGDLVQKIERDLMRIPGFGKVSVEKVVSVLGQMGLSLGMNVGEWKPPR